MQYSFETDHYDFHRTGTKRQGACACVSRPQVVLVNQNTYFSITQLFDGSVINEFQFHGEPTLWGTSCTWNVRENSELTAAQTIGVMLMLLCLTETLEGHQGCILIFSSF